MRPLHETFGRLGNQMFQMAFIYAWAKEHGTDVYLQDPIYFEKYANEIKALYGDITWTGEPMNEFVSIHVRRGDYVDNSFYVDLTSNGYYGRAIAEFPERLFLVFSDDIEWCKTFFKDFPEPITFSEGRTELEDLNLMMHCNGHIIANSTFSWWGAWLGKGKTVCPKQWYSDGYERTICPKEWVRV